MPTSALTRTVKEKRKRWYVLLYERLTALVALANLCLVLFDLTYIPWRDFWLQGRVELYWLRAFGFDQTITLSVPILSRQADSSPVTRLYDSVKGIKPNPDTQRYLNLFDELRTITLKEGVESPEAQQVLSQLRSLSEEIIDTNPFEAAEKSARLGQIKGRMIEHIPGVEDSAKAAFQEFWSVDYLTGVSPEAGLIFFQQQIRPLFETNYFRPISETGAPVNYFPLLDAPFVAFFLLEFVVRTYLISRRYTGLDWQDAMLWRWYDVFLFLPLWRFLRAIPVTVRLGQADLVDARAVRAQVSQGFVASIGQELTEVVVVQVLNQVQASVRQGDLARILVNPDEESTYINVNDIDEIEAIANLVTQLVIYKVLPTVRPDVEALLNYNLDNVIKQLPGYQRLQSLPGVDGFPARLSKQMATEITESLYTGVVDSFEDPVGRELTGHLTQNFRNALIKELSEERPLSELRDLLVDFLEEVKLNYVERLSQEDVEDVLEQTRRLRQKARSSEQTS